MASPEADNDDQLPQVLFDGPTDMSSVVIPLMSDDAERFAALLERLLPLIGDSDDRAFAAGMARTLRGV
jgi:hypothetical protein